MTQIPQLHVLPLSRFTAKTHLKLKAKKTTASKSSDSASPGGKDRSPDTHPDTHVLAVFEAEATAGGGSSSSKKNASPALTLTATSALPLVPLFHARLQQLQQAGVFKGAASSSQFIRFAVPDSMENFLFLGLGQAAPRNREQSALLSHSLILERLRVAGAQAWHQLVQSQATHPALWLETLEPHTATNIPHPSEQSLTLLERIRAFLEGFLLTAAEAPAFFKKTPGNPPATPAIKPKPRHLSLVSESLEVQKALPRLILELEAMAEAVQLTRSWSNLPSNVGTPSFYALEAKKLAAKEGWKCRILSEAEARKEKMGLFLGVGQGSSQESQFVVLEYTPPVAAGPRKPKTLALVGKGVTFDSGGISLKPGLRMEEMKHDMTGAATVVGALLLASRLKVKNRVVALLPFVENMPDGEAIQPGNVLTSRSGKTVEIYNTDAEGRLILADALDFAHTYKPDVIVDLATLTGAVSVALGKLRAALFANSPQLTEQLLAISERTGERLWSLPMDEDYVDDLLTDQADLRNVANDGLGGTIRAAVFLRQFIRVGVSWAHLDIAGTGYQVSHLPYCPKKGASGLFVRTMARLAAELE